MKKIASTRKAYKCYRIQKFSIHLIASVALTAISHSILAENYLDALAVEAESTANVVTSNELDPAEQKQFKKMESLLETERPSTYKFYSKLYPKNKERVFRIYVNDKSGPSDRLSHLQKQVMDLYFNQ